MKQSIANEPVKQNKSIEEDEKIGSSAAQAMFVDNRVQAIAQRRLNEISAGSAREFPHFQAVSLPSSDNGLPRQLRSGIESMSGMSMDDVKVHYNSSAPAQLQAYAYAQGSDIYLGPGQERHLPHEAWHVVQQKQGRVPSMRQMRGIDINDDSGLEHEADVMGEKALLAGKSTTAVQLLRRQQSLPTVQAKSRVRQYAYMPLAEAYEDRLGKYCFTEPHAEHAATQAIAKMKQAMNVDAPSGNAGRVFGGDDPRYPGNVGKDANRVLDAIDNGNLREKMTGFYNASLGPFKKMLSDRINGVGEWADNWDGAKLDLQGRGLDANDGTAIGTRKEQITGSYYDLVPFSGKMKDLYVAPGDFKTRDKDDALYQGQSISSSKQPREEALDMRDNAKLNALSIEGLNQLTMVEGDLVGEHNAFLGNTFGTSTYLKIKTALHDLQTNRGNGSTQAVVLKNLADIRKYTWQWLKDNTKETGILSDFRSIHGQANTKMGEILQAVQTSTLLLPPSLRVTEEGGDDDLAHVPDNAFDGLAHDLFALDRGALIGEQNEFLGEAGGNEAYQAVLEKMGEIQEAVGKKEKIRALHELRVLATAWSGNFHDPADDRLLATVNKVRANDKLKKRVLVERLQKQLEKVYSSTHRSNDDLLSGALDARLSQREKDFLMEEHAPRFDNMGAFQSNAKLPWEEGSARYKPNLNNDWTNEALNVLKMPVMTGPSGTTDRMYQALNFLGNPTDRYDFRLALLGWMLTSKDHSFHEIMAVAKTYGCEYIPGPKSYRSIRPLTEADLRTHVCLEAGYLHLFPDEVEYHTDMDNNRLALYSPIIGSLNRQTQHNTLLENQLGMDIGTYNSSEKPKLLRNVTAYTTTAYAIQNIVANDSKFEALIKIKAMMSTAQKHPTLIAKMQLPVPGLTLEETNAWKALSFAERHMVKVLGLHSTITADELYKEAVRHNEFTLEAMHQLPEYNGIAWRGEAITSLIGNISGYDRNTTFTLNKFMSTSSLDTHANGYVKLARGISTVGGVDQSKWYTAFRTGVILRIQSQHGKIADSVSVNERNDVRDTTVAPRVAEVIFLPGTTFRVTSDPQTIPGKNSPVIDIDEQ
ncbi:eCIS core domain-containing protein [Oxalicibacterium solurbis]|nr:DUF4157 domain-containing protein [Oxalicibacterium solurbis]